MSTVEFKAPRPFAEVQQEYNNTAAQAGDLSYRLLLDTERLKEKHEMMRRLSQEAAAVQAADLKAAQEAAAKETPAPPTPEPPAAA